MSSPTQSRDDVSPGHVAETRDDEEGWSEDEDAEDEGDTRKRKRAKTRRPMSVSCELCKQRKVKCDRGHPSCGWCVRNDQVCEYKERKKPGLRAGYGRELEARLDKLEGVLQNQQSVLQQLASHLSTSPQNGHGLLSTPEGHAQHGSQAETALFMQTPNTYPAAAPIGRRMPDASSQLAGDMNQQGTSFLRHASQTSLQMPASASSGDVYAASDPPLASPSLTIPGTSSLGVTFNENAATLVTQDQDLPPYDLLYALTDLFFKHVNTWCPILHRRTTLDALFGSTSLDEADRILLHAIVATTLRFSQDARLDERSRLRYHTTSKQKVLLYGMGNSSVKALQALVILALDVMGESNGPPGWNLLALITRSVVQLGLAVETTSASVAPLYPSIYTLRAMVLPEPQSFIEDEQRRRLFWMVYILDRYATVATAFEFALSDREIDRKLPCRDDMFSKNQPVDTRWFETAERTDYSMNKPENLGPFSYYVEIISILSQIHQFLKRPVDIGALSDVETWQQRYRVLDNKLSAWKFNLPSEFSNNFRLSTTTGGNKTMNAIGIMLHVTYHTTVIRLHSSAAYPTTRSPIFAPSFSASQRCHGAAEEICALCDYARHNDMLTKLGPPFAFSLWVAARLLLVHGSTIDHKVNPAIGPLVETLKEMGYYWKVAERYATLLSRVLDEYQNSEKGPVGANGVRETPSTVKILADMRRCAYDLDFLISRQPKVVSSGTRLASVTPARTPARTPAPNELEYLDVFDFFNVPRVPFPVNGEGEVGAIGGAGDGLGTADYPMHGNGFNITNFMYDANSDWFTNAM